MTFACRQLPCMGHLSVRLQLQFRVQFVFVVSVFWSCRLSMVLLCLEIKYFMFSPQLVAYSYGVSVEKFVQFVQFVD